MWEADLNIIIQPAILKVVGIIDSMDSSGDGPFVDSSVNGELLSTASEIDEKGIGPFARLAGVGQQDLSSSLCSEICTVGRTSPETKLKVHTIPVSSPRVVVRFNDIRSGLTKTSLRTTNCDACSPNDLTFLDISQTLRPKNSISLAMESVIPKVVLLNPSLCEKDLQDVTSNKDENKLPDTRMSASDSGINDGTLSSPSSNSFLGIPDESIGEKKNMNDIKSAWTLPHYVSDKKECKAKEHEEMGSRMTVSMDSLPAVSRCSSLGHNNVNSDSVLSPGTHASSAVKGKAGDPLPVQVSITGDFNFPNNNFGYICTSNPPDGRPSGFGEDSVTLEDKEDFAQTILDVKGRRGTFIPNLNLEVDNRLSPITIPPPLSIPSPWNSPPALESLSSGSGLHTPPPAFVFSSSEKEVTSAKQACYIEDTEHVLHRTPFRDSIGFPGRGGISTPSTVKFGVTPRQMQHVQQHLNMVNVTSCPAGNSSLRNTGPPICSLKNYYPRPQFSSEGRISILDVHQDLSRPPMQSRLMQLNQTTKTDVNTVGGIRIGMNSGLHVQGYNPYCTPIQTVVDRPSVYRPPDTMTLGMRTSVENNKTGMRTIFTRGRTIERLLREQGQDLQDMERPVMPTQYYAKLQEYLHNPPRIFPTDLKCQPPVLIDNLQEQRDKIMMPLQQPVQALTCTSNSLPLSYSSMVSTDVHSCPGSSVNSGKHTEFSRVQDSVLKQTKLPTEVSNEKNLTEEPQVSRIEYPNQGGQNVAFSNVDEARSTAGVAIEEQTKKNANCQSLLASTLDSRPLFSNADDEDAEVDVVGDGFSDTGKTEFTSILNQSTLSQATPPTSFHDSGIHASVGKLHSVFPDYPVGGITPSCGVLPSIATLAKSLRAAREQRDRSCSQPRPENTSSPFTYIPISGQSSEVYQTCNSGSAGLNYIPIGLVHVSQQICTPTSNINAKSVANVLLTKDLATKSDPQILTAAGDKSNQAAASQQKSVSRCLKPKYFDMVNLQIGTFKYEYKQINQSTTGKIGKVKLLFGKRKLVYEFDCNGMEELDMGTCSLASVEVDLASIVGLAKEDDNHLVIEVATAPQMYLGSRLTTNFLLNMVEKKQTVDLTGGQIGRIPYHKLKLRLPKVAKLIQHLTDFDPHFNAMLQHPFVEDREKRLPCLPRAFFASEETVPKGLPQSNLPSVPAKAAKSYCRCTKGCSSRCGCIGHKRFCQRECGCYQRKTCTNPFNKALECNVDEAALRNDVCLQSNFVQLSSDSGVEKFLQKELVLPCCKIAITVRDCIPGPVPCPTPSCSCSYRFSWCYNEVFDVALCPCYHCENCNTCIRPPDSHFITCRFSEFYEENTNFLCETNYNMNSPVEIMDSIQKKRKRVSKCSKKWDCVQQKKSKITDVIKTGLNEQQATGSVAQTIASSHKKTKATRPKNKVKKSDNNAHIKFRGSPDMEIIAGPIREHHYGSYVMSKTRGVKKIPTARNKKSSVKHQEGTAIGLQMRSTSAQQNNTKMSIVDGQLHLFDADFVPDTFDQGCENNTNISHTGHGNAFDPFSGPCLTDAAVTDDDTASIDIVDAIPDSLEAFVAANNHGGFEKDPGTEDIYQQPQVENMILGEVFVASSFMDTSSRMDLGEPLFASSPLPNRTAVM